MENKVTTMLDMILNPNQVNLAKSINPVLFALVEAVYSDVVDLYELGDESHITENMDIKQVRLFSRNKTIEIVLDKLS